MQALTLRVISREPKVFQEFGKIDRITRRASVMKYIFKKIVDIQYLCWN